jgi:hypothetical protein
LPAIVGIGIVAPFHDLGFLVDLLHRRGVRRRDDQNKDDKY